VGFFSSVLYNSLEEKRKEKKMKGKKKKEKRCAFAVFTEYREAQRNR